MAGYYQLCNCCHKEFNGSAGARSYLDHLAKATYYGVRMSPEATWALSAKAREYLGIYSFDVWLRDYYSDWKPVGPDIIPCAYMWFSFVGHPKAPEYIEWRQRCGLS